MSTALNDGRRCLSICAAPYGLRTGTARDVRCAPLWHLYSPPSKVALCHKFYEVPLCMGHGPALCVEARLSPPLAAADRQD